MNRPAFVPPTPLPISSLHTSSFCRNASPVRTYRSHVTAVSQAPISRVLVDPTASTAPQPAPRFNSHSSSPPPSASSTPSTPSPTPAPPQVPPLQILALTDRWVAVNKPPGILMHRTKLYRTHRNESLLVNVLHKTLSEKLNRRVKVLPVQRLDRPTTGVLICALDDTRNAAMLQQALQCDDAQKQYWLLAFGADMPPVWQNDNPLKDLVGQNRKQRPATTSFEQLAAFKECDVSVVRAALATGRRHQIRRHLSYSRYPILGDTSHGDTRLNHDAVDRFGEHRLCLHARRLSFTDPFANERISLEVPVPTDMLQLLRKLPGYTPDLDDSLDLGDLAVFDRSVADNEQALFATQLQAQKSA